MPGMPVAAPVRESKKYCSEACRVASKQAICRECHAPATMVGDWLHCAACGMEPQGAFESKGTELDAALAENIKNLTIANHWRYGLAPAYEPDPAWKERTRA